MTALIPAAELVRRLADFHIVDVRDRAAYDAGHAPRAVHLEPQRWARLARDPASPVDALAPWAAAVGALGIDGARPVAVHDDGCATEAARVWFILQWHGVDARVLDGGWPALVEHEGLWQVDTQRHAPAPAPWRRPAGHVPRVGRIGRHALRGRLGGDLQVLDARTRAEFDGADLRANGRGGHLPGAHALPHAALLDAQGRLLARPQLRRRFEEADIAPDRPIVTLSDTGARAALAALAAVECGARRVDAYDLGVSDWAADAACPLVSGSSSRG